MNRIYRKVLVVILLSAGGRFVGASDHQRALDLDLMKAAKYNKTEEMQRLLAAGANPNAFIPGEDPFGLSYPLVSAVNNRNSRGIEILVAAGADPKLGNALGTASLQAQFPRRDDILLKSLQPKPVDRVRFARRDDILALQSKPVAEIQASSFMDDIGKLSDPQRALDLDLMKAAKHNKTEEMQRLLAAGANPNAFIPGEDPFGLSYPLSSAVNNRNLRGVEMLMAAGADPKLGNVLSTASLQVHLTGNNDIMKALKTNSGAEIQASLVREVRMENIAKLEEELKKLGMDYPWLISTDVANKQWANNPEL